MALLLNRCYYCRHKDRHLTDPTEEIFFAVMVICCTFEFSDCFQWFVLLDDFVGCAVLGVIREYTLISLLVIMVCLGTHLLILMTKPKCLQVINEVKLKRHKIIQKIYVIASFLVPIIFVPWPFTSVQYGKEGYVCWLRNSGCGTSGISNILSRLLMWYFWALLVWLYIVLVFALFLYTYCSRRNTTVTTRMWKPDLNSITIISILIVFIVQVLASVLLLLWGWIKRQSSFPLTVLVAVLTPFTLIVFFVILVIRQVSISRTWHIRILKKAEMTTVTYQTISESESISMPT